eukprot:jgi/Chlat1/8345/Chrsp8S00675
MSSHQGENDGVKDLLKKDSSVQDAVFGVLYTLSKEKYARSKKFALIAIVLDYFQMLVFMVGQPFPWHIDTGSVLFKLISYVQLNNPLVALGHTSYLVVFLLLSIMLLGSAALCGFVAHNFKTGHFPYVWPIKLLRFFISIFFSIFYISSLNTFMISFDCRFRHLPAGTAPYVEAFPEQKCLNASNMFLAGFGVCMCVLFFAIALLLELAESEQDPLTDNVLGSPDSREGIIIFLLKTVMTIVTTLASNAEYMKLQAIVLLFASWVMEYRVIRWVPCYSPFVNRFRSALFCSLAAQAATLMLLVLVPAASQALTVLMVVLSFLSLPAGWFALEFRLRRVLRVANKFLNQPVKAPGEDEEELHDFRDPQEVEICSRCLRVGEKKRKRVMVQDEAQVNAAELILLTGLAQFPDSPFLHVVYASFLIRLRKNQVQAQFHMEKARGLNPGVRERFMIFVRDRERKHSLQSESTGEASMDLVSYVEFQNNYNLSLASHKNALKATRRFWRVVMVDNVSFSLLASAFNNIDSAESKADRAYRTVLERYPRSVKLLRSYGHFLEEVRNDPWAARKYYTEADKQEEALAQLNQEAGEGDGGANGRIDDTKDGMVVINKVGIIQFTNKVVLKMLGYKKDEVWGKNVRILMPAPYSTLHDSYLAAYNTTGRAKVIGSTRSVEAKHKEGHTIPINLSVNKVETNGEVSFTGVLRPADDDDMACVTLSTPSCNVQGVNKAFSNMFGYKVGDIAGKNFRKLIATRHLPASADLQEFLAQFKADPTNEHVGEKPRVDGMHKSGDEFPVMLEVVTKDGNVMEVKIQSLNDQLGILTIDVRGKVVSANKFACEMFGYTEEALAKMNVSSLMPLPYSRFHSSYLKKYAATGKGGGRVIGSVTGRTVAGLHRDGSTFAMALEVRELKDEATNARMYSGRITMADPRRPDNNRIDLIVRIEGEIKTASSASTDILGIPPEELEGEDAAGMLTFLDGKSTPLHERLAHREHETMGFTCWSATAKHRNGSTVQFAVVMDHAEHESESVLAVQLWSLAAVEGVIGITDGGVITQVNRGVEIMFGYRSNELVSGNITKLMTSDIAAEHPSYLSAYKQTGRKKVIGSRRSMVALHKNTSSIFVDIEVAEVGRATAGLAEGTVYIARLVSGQPNKENMKALSRSNTARMEGGGAADPSIVRGRPSLADLPSPGGGVVAAAADQLQQALAAAGKQLGPPGLGGRSSPSLGACPVISDGGVARMGARLPYALEAFMKDRAEDLPNLADQVQSPLSETVESPTTAARRTVRFSIANNDDDEASATKASGPKEMLRLDSLREQPSDKESSDRENIDDSDRLSAMDPSELNESEADGKDGGGGGGGNFQRAKRYRSILKLVSNSKMRSAISALSFHTRIIAIILMLSHVLCFVVLRIEVQAQVSLEKQVKVAGDGTFYAQLVAIDARVLQHNGGMATNASAALITATEAKMNSHLDSLESVLEGLYLGFKGLSKPGSKHLQHLFDDPILNITVLEDNQPPTYRYDLLGLWDAGKFYMQSARQVALPHNHSRDAESAAWQYVMRNGPPTISPALIDAQYDVTTRATTNVQRVQMFQSGVYVFEGGFVFFLTMLYLWSLLRRVAEERVGLFTVFIFVPRPIVRALASRPISVGAEESDDDLSDNEFQQKHNVNKSKAGGVDEDDEDEGNINSAPGASNTDLESIKQKVRRSFKTNAVMPVSTVTQISLSSKGRKRHLNSTGADSYKFMVPTLAFGVLTLLSFMIGRAILIKNTEPLADTNAAQVVSYLQVRTRFYAAEVVLAQTNGNNGSLPELRQLLNTTASRMQFYYESLLYGNHDLNLQGSLYHYPMNVKLLFGHGCLSGVPANCYNNTNPYYPMTNNGLDGLIYYYIQQAQLLSQDAAEELNWSNPRFQFMWTVGPSIMHDAFNTWINIYYGTVGSRSQINLVVQSLIFVSIVLGT